MWHLTQLAEHPALRWLGPHSGVTHLAIASICNACFDLWSKVHTTLSDCNIDEAQ
jgi:hypothetical protein